MLKLTMQPVYRIICCWPRDWLRDWLRDGSEILIHLPNPYRAKPPLCVIIRIIDMTWLGSWDWQDYSMSILH